MFRFLLNLNGRKTLNRITEFQGPYRFLSNFWPAKVEYEGVMYPSAEHAYQAAKSDNQEYKKAILECKHVGYVKRLGKTAKLIPNWDQEKVGIMFNIVRDKFMRNPDLKEKLLATGDMILEEGNWWKDRYWGISPAGSGQGQNQLGKILMTIRSRIRETESNEPIAQCLYWQD